MRRLTVLFIISIIALGISANGLFAEEAPYMLVRVDVNADVKVIPLLKLGLDIADGVKGQYVDVVCHPQDLAKIRALGYRAEVLNSDLERYYSARLQADPMGGYHTWSEAIQELVQIHADHPNITTEPFSIGTTIEGREMHVIKISDNPEIDEDEPEIFFNSMIHAREAITVEMALGIIDRLTDDYGIDPYITDLVDTREIWVMPIFNPDGYVYNEQQSPGGGGMWRKNRRDNGGGSYGVDLNRNWGFNWGYNNIGSSGSPGSETYRGTAPFSEPETEVVRQFCNAHQFGIVLNFHSYSNLMLYSWSIPDAPWGYTPDNATFQALSQTMQQWNGYTYGTCWEILYQVNGDANDWQYGEQVEKPKSLAWVFEIGSSFWPDPSQIPFLVGENMPACLFLIEQVENYMPTAVNLAYLDGIIDDTIGGNGNAGLDPGESVLFTPTLRNNGWETGTGISAELIAVDPYINITVGNASYPNMDPGVAASSTMPYEMSVSASCPLEHSVNFGLIWTCNEGFSDTAQFTLMVGDPLYQPMGPDAYGYMAYDNFDEAGPEFNWVEVDPTYGGPGTLINYTQDDQTIPVSLPFTFQYYGQTYNEISVCGNGWIAMGMTTDTDYSNSAIPDADGPPAMIAPFWEDLSPQDVGQVAYYYDSAENYFIVEFDSVRQYLPTNALETFEVIFFDPAYYPTTTGDGQILFQYNQISDPNVITVGIENLEETIGLQLLYDGDLDSHVPPLEPGIAVLFTTATSTPAMIVEVNYVSGSPIPASGGDLFYGIWGENQEPVALDYDIWIDKIYESTDTTTLILREITNYQPGWQINRPDAWYPVPDSWPGGNYDFRIYSGWHPEYDVWHTDAFSWVKDGPVNLDFDFEANLPLNAPNPFEDIAMTQVDNSMPAQFEVLGTYPNPFNPLTTISFALPEASRVILNVYDISGRLVSTLVNGSRDAGIHDVTFDASHLASGIYLYRMEAGEFTSSGKMVLMK
ncbi:hypothetical protein CEE37_14360 [candidate division LCP-89 bacterium B3_LCP]|uniref:carboxypeptidase T n=1 Tax=candidate division LCP-89 bacterium B3_LCP TaxID=2012998 RepID=A0A532UPM7_UNCL8|nr:MAG: hypothetical protein CEE37_14360 [candidate division LCP-89 bacterium B3_LCP]